MAKKKKPEASASPPEKMAKHTPERKCILSNRVGPAEMLVRLVQGPDGILVPDVAARLPVRGLWVNPAGEALRKAVTDGSLHKAAARSLKARLPKGAVAPELVDQIDQLLERRCLDRLGLEQRAGNLVTGFDKIRAALGKKGAGKPAMIVTATDGAEDGQRKIQAIVGVDMPTARLFDREALSKALGRENVVHIVLFESGGTVKLMADIGRLLNVRGLAPLTCEAQGIEE